MAKPSSPSQPHRSSHEPRLHVDIRGPKEKVHAVVKDRKAATVIAAVQRQGERARKGRS